LTKHLYQYFCRGLITALPLGLTVYLLYVFLRWTETLAMQLVRPFIGEYYLPGMGLLLGIVGIFLLGFLVSQRGTGRLLLLVELPFTNLPVVKSIYSSFKSFADYFSPQREKGTQQNGGDPQNARQVLEVVGLVTRQHVDDLPAGFCRATAWRFICRWVHDRRLYGFRAARLGAAIDMSVEEAMRASLFAWMSASGSDGSPGQAGHDPRDGQARRLLM